MFEKKCKICGNKVERKFDYCPYCGNALKSEREIGQKGMLDEDFEDMNSIFGKMGGMPFQGIIGKLMKEMDKQMKDIDKMMPRENEMRKQPQQPQFNPNIRTQGISVSISTSENGEPIIKVRGIGDLPNAIGAMPQQGMQRMPQKQTRERKSKIIPRQKAEKIAQLPRTEPQTSVRRLSDRIIYEIDMPNVKKENVFIQRLQNSIEIKAFTKDKAFFKLLPVSLPILRHYIQNNKLILELKPEM